jgi:hypothetical protein
VQNNILAAGAVWIHPRIAAKESGNASFHGDTPLYWLVDSGYDAEQRALASTVASQQRQPITALEGEVHAIQRLNDDMIRAVMPDAAAGAKSKHPFL